MVSTWRTVLLRTYKMSLKTRRLGTTVSTSNENSGIEKKILFYRKCLAYTVFPYTVFDSLFIVYAILRFFFS